MDLEAYAEGKMDTVTIGNAEYTAMPESNSIEKTYMYRYEQSGTSYDIRVKGQEIDDSDKELLEGIVLKLEDEGNKDAPWPWEGEPVEPVLTEQMVVFIRSFRNISHLKKHRVSCRLWITSL